MNEIMPTHPCEPALVNNWTDCQRICPSDPRDLIAYAVLGSTVGQFDFSTDFIEPGAWSATPLVFSNKPVVTALESDNQLKVADANQWNFLNLTWNSASALAIPRGNSCSCVACMSGTTVFTSTSVVRRLRMSNSR